MTAPTVFATIGLLLSIPALVALLQPAAAAADDTAPSLVEVDIYSGRPNPRFALLASWSCASGTSKLLRMRSILVSRSSSAPLWFSEARDSGA